MTGVAWYFSEQWSELKQVISDPDQFEAIYEDWEAVIKRRSLEEVNEVAGSYGPNTDRIMSNQFANDPSMWCFLGIPTRRCPWG